MIVPFIMTMLTIQDRPYLWAFYKFLDYAKRRNGALIAQEEYFADPSELAEMGRAEACNKAWNENNELRYDLPRKEDFEFIKKYMIPKSFEEDLIKRTGSINDAQMYLLKETDGKLKEILGKYMDEIREESADGIHAFITLCHNPSLSAAAAERNIPVIHFEIGTFREPTYLKTGYFDLNCLYGAASTEKRYQAFLSEIERNPIPVLSNKEILAIMLRKEYLHYLNRMDHKPKYEMGIALGYAVWPIYQRNTYCDDSELLYRAKKLYSVDELLVRRHPGDPLGAAYPRYDYCRDASATPLDFLLQCKRIASVGSNLSFEAMMFGRTSYVLTECPYTYRAKRVIEDTALQDYDMYYLNFFTFAYLIPFSLLWDEDYIKWRLTGPDEADIYRKHLEFYCVQKGIPMKILESDPAGRLHKILEAQDYDLEADYANVKLKPKRVFTVSDYKKEISRLENLLEEKRQDT